MSSATSAHSAGNLMFSFSPNDPLAHLVEVATALARMPQDSPRTSAVGIASPPPSASSMAQQQTQGDSDYFSVVSNDEDESQKLTTTRTQQLSSPLNPSQQQPYSKREIFPQRLLAILNDPTLTEVVAWLPHGRSFVIIRPGVFTEQVLPKYLPPTDARSSTKYASFTRKLNRWYVQ